MTLALNVILRNSLESWLAMMTTLQIFDQIKYTHGLRSDSALASLLGCSPALICKHRSRAFAMDNPLALRCAELLGLDPAQVLLMVAVERAKSPAEKEAFVRLMALAEGNARGLAASTAWNGARTGAALR